MQPDDGHTQPTPTPSETAAALAAKCAKTPGYRVTPEPHGWKVLYLRKNKFARIPDRLYEANITNVMTRLRNIGWTHDNHDRLTAEAERHRNGGVLIDPFTPALKIPQDPDAQPARALPEEDPRTAAANAAPVEIITVTPAMAIRWLEAIPAYQRKLNRTHVNGLKTAMLRGEWRLTPATISLDTNGLLADGQHRMAAIAETGLEQTFYLIRGIPPENYMLIDKGRGRNMGDTLSGLGEKHHGPLSSALRLLYLWCEVDQAKWISEPRSTDTQLLKILDEHPDLRDSISPSRLPKLRMSSPACTVAHYLITQRCGNDASLSDRFFHSLREGIGLQAGHPCLTMRNWMISGREAELNRANPGRTGPFHLFLLMRTWEKCATGKSYQKVSWKAEYSIPEAAAPRLNSPYL